MQDIILTVGSILLAAALVPTLISHDKPALATSLLAGFVLGIFSAVYVSLGLWFAAATTFVTSLCWFVLAFQKHRQPK